MSDSTARIEKCVDLSCVKPKNQLLKAQKLNDLINDHIMADLITKYAYQKQVWQFTNNHAILPKCCISSIFSSE
jgi:hypothetical protein